MPRRDGYGCWSDDEVPVWRSEGEQYSCAVRRGPAARWRVQESRASRLFSSYGIVDSNRKPPEHHMKRCILFLLAWVVAGCSSGLTLSGYQTRPISMLSAEDCTFVGPASDVRQTRSSAVLDNAIETANARNRASEIGGNAVVFSITASTPRTSSFQMNSYRCPATLIGQ